MTLPAAVHTPRIRLVEVGALVLLSGIALIRGVSPFFEPDYWWHLRAGEQILSSGRLERRDFSAAFSDRPYLATQWLPETAAAFVYRIAGTGGVLWLRAVVIITLTLVVYLTARRCADRLPASLAAGVAVLGAGASLNPRPQLLSFLFFAIVLHAWWATAQDQKVRWWLIPVFWIWACSHGLSAFGVLVGLLFTLSFAIDPSTRQHRQVLLRLAVLNAACVGIIATTPLGPRLLTAPLSVASNASWMADEWKATPVTNPFAMAAMSAVVLTAVLWTRQTQRPPLWQVLLLAFSAGCTLWMWRLVPLGVIAAAPLLANAVQESLPVGRRQTIGADGRVAFTTGTAASLAGLLLCLSPVGAQAAKYPEEMPRVDDALALLPRGTVVFADFGLSGWLLWRHPALVPVADLRVEIYAEDHLRDYVAAEDARPGWDRFIERTGSRYAVVKSDSAIAGALSHTMGWEKLASSANYVLVGPPTSETR